MRRALCEALLTAGGRTPRSGWCCRFTLYDRVAEIEQVRRALCEALPGTGLSLFAAIAFMQHALQSRGSGE